MESDRERSPEPPLPVASVDAPAPLPPVSGLSAETVMALQRTAGNASVTRMLARAPHFPPPTKAPPKPALDASRFNPEDAAICREAGEFVSRAAELAKHYNAAL